MSTSLFDKNSTYPKHERLLVLRVSDAGREDRAKWAVAGVRKPPRNEPAGDGAVLRVSDAGREDRAKWAVAGVRKPPRNEPAGDGARNVPRTRLWGFE
jgi:hypothetical protein